MRRNPRPNTPPEPSDRIEAIVASTAPGVDLRDLCRRAADVASLAVTQRWLKALARSGETADGGSKEASRRVG